MTDLHIESRITEVINRLFNPQNIHVNQETTLITDLQMDSRDLLGLVMEVEDMFNIEKIPDSYINGFATVGSVIGYVNQVKYPC